MNPILKKRLVLTAKILVVLAVIGWAAWELWKSREKISLLDWKPDYVWLTLSGVFYITAYIPAAFFWRYVMTALGQTPGWYESFRAYYIGHLGKYIPGKVMVVILRSGLLNRRRTQASVAAAAVFLETLTMMAAGAFVAAFILLVWFRDIRHGNYLTALAVGMMLCSAVPVFPPLFRRLAKKLGVGRNDPEIDKKLSGLTLKTLLTGWILMIPVWIFLGLGLWATVRGIGIEPGALNDVLPLFTLAASLSVVLGFITMIPAGAGVREWATAQILDAFFLALLLQQYPDMNPEEAQRIAVLQAILVVAVHRGISIVSELAASALLCFRFQKEKPD